MSNCTKCGNVISVVDVFCSRCGSTLAKEPKPLLYIGESVTKSVYEITFAPVQGVFDSEDGVHEAAQHSCWNEDESLHGYKVEWVRTAVPVDRYPFICKGCSEFVSDTKDGQCANCSGVEWEERDNDNKDKTS